MKYYSLFFEARGIQSYIFDSGKMKEMVESVTDIIAATNEDIKKLSDALFEKVDDEYRISKFEKVSKTVNTQPDTENEK